MKKTAIFLLASGMLFLSSCTKRHCWKCTVVEHVEPYGIIDGSTRVEMVCGKNYWEIRQYEKDPANTFSVTTVNNGITQTVSRVTTCQ